MAHRDYPWMLYRGDESMVVENSEEKAAAEADGWHVFGAEPSVPSVPESSKPKRVKKGSAE